MDPHASADSGRSASWSSTCAALELAFLVVRDRSDDAYVLAADGHDDSLPATDRVVPGQRRRERGRAAWVFLEQQSPAGGCDDGCVRSPWDHVGLHLAVRFLPDEDAVPAVPAECAEVGAAGQLVEVVVA